MKHTLYIQLSSCEGAVIRVLGLIERRGYSLRSCTVSESDGTGRDMLVAVSSTRSGDLLKRQLERLHDVFFVKLEPVADFKHQNPGIRPITRRA